MPPQPPEFDRFVAIDWSGAKGARHKGIAVAVAGAGVEAPRLVPPPSRIGGNGGGWARAEVADWLESDLATRLRQRADLLEARLVDPLWRAFATRALQIAA